MHIKFLAHGGGSGRKAVAYLLGTHDHSGKERAEVRVLRGDPEMVGMVADSLPFAKRYTSGVVAWALEDNPSDEQIDQVLDDIERVAFAGIGVERVVYTAVLHVDQDGSKHLHWVADNVDLATGKSFNPAPPGWQKAYGALRDMHNYRHGWARPDDPARRRPIPVKLAAAEFRAKRGGLLSKREREKEQITAWIMDEVLAGRIRNRAGVIAALEGLGEIIQQDHDYISVRIEGYAKPFRLQGPIYSADFDAATADEFRAERGGFADRGHEKEQITARIMAEVLAGRIRDRAGVIAALEGLGKITRKGKDYVSVRIEGYDKPFRLKGPIYGADFDAEMADELILDDHADRHGLLEVSSAPDPEEEEDAREAMEAAIEGWEKYNRKRYPAPAPMPVPTKKLKKPEVIDDGNRDIISRLAEEIGSAIQRARAAIRSAFERFDVALRSYDSATERHDEQLSEIVTADQNLIESARRYEQHEQRQRERDEVDLDAAMARKPGSGPSGPGM